MINKQIIRIILTNLRALLTLLVCILPTLTAAQTTIDGIRSNELLDKQQIVIDTQGEPTFKAFSLPNPPRIVVDITVDKAGKVAKNLALDPNRIIRSVRTGIQSGTKMRVVVDLLEKAEWKAYTMEPQGSRGYRVVIDVFNRVKTLATPKVATQPIAKTPPKKVTPPVNTVKPPVTLTAASQLPPVKENSHTITASTPSSDKIYADTEPTAVNEPVAQKSLFGRVFGWMVDEPDNSNEQPTSTRPRDIKPPTVVQPSSPTLSARGDNEPGLPVNMPTSNRMYRFRVNRHDNKLQFVVDVQRSPTFKAFTLKNPSRLVVDVAAKTALPYDNEVKQGKYRGVTHIRQGVRSGSVRRLVFDLAANYQWEVTRLLPDSQRGHRLVIDIYDNPKAVVKTPTQPPKLETASTSPTPKIPSNNTDIAFVPLTPKQPAQPLELLSPDANKTPSKSAKTTSPKRSLVRPDLITVVIDPGHGGRDAGATGVNGTKEKTIMLDIAKRLKRKIDSVKGMRGVLTRSRDKYVSLPRRVRMAREYKADLFVSIHADAFSQSNVFGSSTYVLSEEGSSETAERLAEIENAVDEKYGIGIEQYDDIGQVLFDIQQDATIESSYIVAQKILSQLKTVGKVHKRKVERANFSVLRSPGVPSVLIETAFISNPKEEKRLLSTAYRNKVANALATGIKNYFKEYLPHHFAPINTAPKTSE